MIENSKFVKLSSGNLHIPKEWLETYQIDINDMVEISKVDETGIFIKGKLKR